MTRALVRAKLSAREAARRAGISEGRWRQIAGGYQVVSAGVYAPVHGPAGTLARMAAAVGVTPAQLRRAGRPDAARALAAAPAEGDVGQELLQRVRAMNSDQARELLATIALQLGLRLQAEPAPGRERPQGVLVRGACSAAVHPRSPTGPARLPFPLHWHRLPSPLVPRSSVHAAPRPSARSWVEGGSPPWG